MRFLAIALAYEEERFIKGYPPKGANLLLYPNYEISQLANLISKRDELIYFDERVQAINFEIPFDTALIFSNFGQANRTMELVLQLTERGKRSIVFGPLPSTWQNSAPSWLDSYVIGSILNVYPTIREDLAHGTLKKQYCATNQPTYLPPYRALGETHNFYNKSFQPLQAVIGCFCLPPLKPFCRQYLYYTTNVLKRSLIEVIGEIISLPYKHITLLDDDITKYLDYYCELFTLAWNYRKHWTVQASHRLFEHPNFIRLLAKAGTRIVFLNEDWFPPLFSGIISENFKQQNDLSHSLRIVREKRRQVKMLHSERMLVGAKLSLLYYPASAYDFNSIYQLLNRLNLDFLVIKFFKPASLDNKKLGFEIEPILLRYSPMLTSTNPAWLKNRFYTLGRIIYRAGRRPFSVGFYNTLFYLIPYSFAYRQNFLEGIVYPP